MRTIKFRGKRKDTDEWVYGNLLIIDGGYFIIPEKAGRTYKIFNNRIILELSMFYEVIPETVGQWTGLYDTTLWEELTKKEQQLWIKNGNKKENWKGKEIYEDDIVKTDTVPQIVVYNEALALFGLRLFSGGATTNIEPSYIVIGNIHDNFELLVKEVTDV